jgi:dTDP-4-amino-4,6-dideoxygalactose transaminase
VTIRVPQTDPRANYLAHDDEIDAAIAGVLKAGRYILGEEVAAFEEEFARFVGCQHAIGVANGTDALHLALRACEIGPGDSVLTVSHTAVATAAAIELAGARPVFVDIDPDTFTMDPAAMERTIVEYSGTKPRAVVVVHLFGHPANMQAIMEIAARHGVQVIEDCAQSHGAVALGRATGTIGRIAAFSFYPTKNLGAIGDGGAITTDDASLAEKVRLLRQYGWRQRYVSEIGGVNSRLDELQAAILRVKLRHLASDNARRIAIAHRYRSSITSASVTVPIVRDGYQHVFHQFVVRSTRRDELRAWLDDRNIGSLIHYPVPVHQQPAYASVPALVLPETERAAREILSLPMFPELSTAQVEHVAEAVRMWSELAMTEPAP